MRQRQCASHLRSFSIASTNPPGVQMVSTLVRMTNSIFIPIKPADVLCVREDKAATSCPDCSGVVVKQH